MAFRHSPTTITNGLVLYLDAANSKSYTSGSTTWYDLTSANNGTLTNGPFFTGSANGSIFCDGTNDYILANTTNIIQYFTSSFSHFIWYYPQTAGQIVVELGQTTINVGWHDSNIEISTSGSFSFSTWHSGLSNKVVSTVRNFNQWYHLGMTYTGTTLTAYINGINIGTASFTRNVPSNLYYALCANDSTNMGTYAFSSGRIGTFSVYNRGLNNIEVLQLYNTTKGRFGLA